MEYHIIQKLRNILLQDFNYPTEQCIICYDIDHYFELIQCFQCTKNCCKKFKYSVGKIFYCKTCYKEINKL